MKKILLTTIAASSCLAAFGQGTIVFENYNNSNAYITLNAAGSQNAAPVGTPGFAVSLLWYNGTSFQTVATYQTTASDVPGGFYGPTVDLPTYSATGTFEVEGWYNASGHIASYAAAVATANTYTGITASFTAAEGEVSPPLPAGNLVQSTPVAGQWNGDLVLIVPEPSTIALGGLGAAALLLFRRKK